MNSDEHKLLQSLHSGILEQPPWQSFLCELRSRLKARYVAFSYRVFPDDPVITLHSGEPQPEELSTLIVDRHLANPLPDHTLQDCVVYSYEILLDPGDPDQSAAYFHALKRKNIAKLYLMRVTERRGVQAWLNCAMPDKNEMKIKKTLQDLSQHIQTALSIYVEFERQRWSSEISLEADERLNFAWVTVDKHCKIIRMTPNANRILSNTDLVQSIKSNEFSLQSTARNRQLKSLIKNLSIGDFDKPTALNLSRDPWVDILVAPIRHHPITSIERPVAIIYLRSDFQTQENRVEQLVEFFGLRLSEARLAWSIVQGMTIAEAANNLNISIETARGYSKQVFAKTGTKSQSDLVRTVLTSVLALY